VTSDFPDYIFIDDTSVRETRISNMRRSDEFETGPQRQAAYSCKTLYQLRFDMSICLDDYDTFLNWYEVTLRQGTAWFHMICPIRGTQFRFRFIDSDLDFRKFNDSMRKSCIIERWGGLDG